MELVIFIVYYLAARWACTETIWKDTIFFGTFTEIAVKKMVVPLFTGWILIPIALIKVIFSRII